MRDAATGIRVFGSTSKTIRSGKGPASRWPFSFEAERNATSAFGTLSARCCLVEPVAHGLSLVIRGDWWPGAFE
jgi:hypothetical protein